MSARAMIGVATGCVLMACTTSVAVDHALPDFDAYQRVDMSRYEVGAQYGSVIHAFRTPDGFSCQSSQNRALFSLSCDGPFVGAPNEAHTVHLHSVGATVRDMDFERETVGGVSDSSYVVLPDGVVYAASHARCVRASGILLACEMAGDGRRGFVATADGTTTFTS